MKLRVNSSSCITHYSNVPLRQVTRRKLSLEPGISTAVCFSPSSLNINDILIYFNHQPKKKVSVYKTFLPVCPSGHSSLKFSTYSTRYYICMVKIQKIILFPWLVFFLNALSKLRIIFFRFLQPPDWLVKVKTIDSQLSKNHSIQNHR